MTAPVSRPQVGRIIATLAALGVHERAERLAVLAALVYRPITSTNDLTAKEGRVCIDLLDGLKGRDAPAEALARLCEPGAAWLAREAS